LVGGTLADFIDGGADKDFLVGSLGDDDIQGGDDDDVIFGNSTPLLPDRFDYVTRGGQSEQNDSSPFATLLPGLAADHAENGTTFHGLTFASRDKDSLRAGRIRKLAAGVGDLRYDRLLQ
jgi:hypothetical protein